MTKAPTPVDAASKQPRKRATKPAAKPATKRKLAAKPAAVLAVAPNPRPTIVQPFSVVAPLQADAAVASAPLPGSGGGDDSPTLRRKDFLERVLTRSGAKKKDAQTVIDATLKVLSEAFSNGEAVVLPQFGKARVSRQVDVKDGEMLVIKLRRGGEAKPGKGKKTADESLAEDDD